ncbi:hypothetical protein BRARA_D01205, partial [Brassica rapa]
YVRAVPTTDVNRNTEWFTYPGVWTTCILILLFSWPLVLSVFHCSPRPFHRTGIYNRLTWWEQVDNGNQLTPNRKFLTLLPILLYLIASHTTDYQHPMLFVNTLAVFVMVVAKFPHMHKVRIFGIIADQ